MPAALRSLSRPRPRAASPQNDPRYRGVVQQLQGKAAQVKKHPAAKQKASEAAAAAKGPPNEKKAGAQANQVEKIQEAPTRKPEPQSFLQLLRAEIEKVMPKTLGDTEKFMKGGSSSEVKGSLKGNITQQKEEATGGVKSAAKQTPDESAVQAKQVTPIPGEPAPPAPRVDGAAAMPAPKPDTEVSLQDSKQDVDQQMKDAEVTTPQLQKANDPRFTAVVSAKEGVAKQADTAPNKFRAKEQTAVSQAKGAAATAAIKGAASIIGVKSTSKSAVLSRQAAAKAKDEQERQKVAATIEGIFNETKTRVEAKLNDLESTVNQMFDSGVDSAIQSMKSYVEDRIFKYKLDRYLSIPIVGAARWIRDQFMGLPEEVNAFYLEGRNLFQRLMDGTVRQVANIVETRLREAKQEVAFGQARIKTYVAGLPKNLKAVGEAAQKEVSGRFEELERGIDDKKDQLAQSLAQKYKEAFDKADQALKEIQDENKGLVQAFIEKLGEIIKILTEFKDKLIGLFKKGWETIKMIIADPIGFLSNLLSAIKKGISQFVDNIWTHLKQGFMKWLFGSLASAGIELPTDLTLPSILKLVLGVLGLTYDRLRAKAVKLLGPTAVMIIEKLVGYVKALIDGGPQKLWEQVKADLTSLKEMVIDAIQSWLIETVIKQAVTKLVSMFNPAGAIIQAIIAIYNTVMFLIERAAQIMEFIEAIINSVAAIAQGAIAGAANWIEQSLARAIPLVISLLARLIGLGGISDKIKEIIKKIQGVVDRAIDKVLGKIVGLVKKLFGKGKGDKKDERTDAQKQADLDKGVAEGNALLENEDLSPEDIRTKLEPIQKKYKMTTLQLATDSKSEVEEVDHIVGEVNPKKEGSKKKKPLEAGEYKVDVHPVTIPKKKGDSHHVAFKVLKRWIGEILELAGNALLAEDKSSARGKRLRDKGREFKGDSVGNNLSAIWLSKKSHVQAHAPAKPGQLDLKGEFVVKTQADVPSTKPTRSTIAATVHSKVLGDESKAQTKEARNRKIYDEKADRLPSLFQSVFDSMLEAGVALVGRVKLKDDKWQGLLKKKAKETWKDVLKPKL